uniref:C2H2-type domain-containing protein n=1 Tax=Paramormyrops kingsleyae TaxID=1676925 RepID=A0A3B3RI04_9TELE
MYRFHRHTVKPVPQTHKEGNALACTAEGCSFVSVHISTLCNHLQLHIKDGKKVSCPYDNCTKYFRVCSSFSSHVSRKHKIRAPCTAAAVSVSTASSVNSEMTQTFQTGLDGVSGDVSDELGIEMDDENNNASNEVDENDFINSLALFYLQMQAKIAIQAALPQLDREKLETVVGELVSKLGVEGPDDLQFIKEEDVRHLLTPIQCRKLLHTFKRDSRIGSVTSSPEEETVASSSTVSYPSQRIISCENSDWLSGFQVPWEEMRPTLRRAIDAGKRPEAEDRRHMVKVTVDSMREHCLNPTRKDCTAVAKAIIQKYPGSFLDKTEEGETIGCGYFSLLNQLKTRIEYITRGNTLSRLRKPRCSQASNDDQTSAPKCARIDSYGCIRWQPQEYPEGETLTSLEEKRKEMVDIFSQEGLRAAERGRVKELMTITYIKQREDINADPPSSILDITKQWPFLQSWKFLLYHFTTLTGVELQSRLNEDLDKKGKRLLEFFRCQLMKWSKEVKAVLQEALNTDREGTDGLAAMLVMMAHFKVAEDALFLLADVSMLSLFVIICTV